jgi:hypothetical protein
VLVNKRFEAPCYRPQTLASNLAKSPTSSGQAGRRPVYGGTAKFQDDPHWRDLILFYEYFQGDNGAGLGASHQTGWTGLIARLLDVFGRIDAKDVELEYEQVISRLVREQVGGETTGGN